jgi:outer membrane protein OmpA-like peptidoglycan-associated protein
MRSLFLVLLLGLISNICFTQSNTTVTDRRNIYDEKGDFYFDKADYKKAIVYYNMAFKKDVKNYYSVLRKAEAYTALELFPQAIEAYRILFESNLRIPNVYRLQYAFVLLENNNIQEFEKWIERYNEVVNSEIEGKNYISSQEDRVKLYKDSTIVLVGRVNELNSRESDISPVVYGNQILFASTRKNIEGTTSNNNYDVFSSGYKADGGFEKVSVFNSSLNTSQNEGSICFFDITNSMYFTRSASQKTNLKTYTSNIPYAATDLLDVSALLLENFTSVGQLSLNSNGTIMYFVSEDNGGKGGLDIYTSNLVNGQWAAPVNLGDAINTSGDEMYPFIFHDSILYFASNGHNGYGGLDIFCINLNDKNGAVQNLGDKVNTSYDDFGLSLSPEGYTGYFSSNRPGGLGKEDIYRVNILNLKIKYAAYQHKLRTSMEEGKVNLYLSNGDEYNIASKENEGFDFSFLPQEDYKMIIQHENPTVEDIIMNKAVTVDQREKDFLKPAPIQQAEIKLQAGMKYRFAAGMKPISATYKNDLIDLSNSYQDASTSTIDLTALAKELLFTEGEIYTIRFVKDDSQSSGYKAKGESSIFIDEQTVGVFGQSFFMVLPLENEANFNIQTDITYLQENFNAKKYGIVVDQGAVFKEDAEGQKWLISMLVNTDSIGEVNAVNHLTANEISIIPGTEYILTLGRIDPTSGEEVEIIVPLTRGVKYNLGAVETSKAEYKKALAELVLGRKGLEPENEEVIDISMLSKEIQVQSGEDLTFNLLPAKQFGKNVSNRAVAPTNLNLDGKIYELNRVDKYSINVPFTLDGKVNIQTDITYIQENFDPNAFVLSLDTIPFFSEIVVDTTGYSKLAAEGWLLSMSVNTDSTETVDPQNQLSAQEVSIIPGREYILTVSKKDGLTGKETEIIVPLTRLVKYDFTSNPESEEVYKASFDTFLQEQEDFETTGGELIDISILSKELEIKEGDDVSFSLLPAKVFRKDLPKTDGVKSSLYLDDEVVEFTEIQKYTINIPVSDDARVNLQTDIEHLQENFQPGTYTLDIDTLSFFTGILVDTTGYYKREKGEDEITDPVFDVITVNFDLNAYTLRPEAKSTIESKVAQVLKSDKRLYVTIKGYTDALGNADYNEKLSRDRAQSVKDYLARSGIGENRIRTFSFGESQALEEGVNWEDLDESELEKHRKVEIVIYLPE